MNRVRGWRTGFWEKKLKTEKLKAEIGKGRQETEVRRSEIRRRKSEIRRSVKSALGKEDGICWIFGMVVWGGGGGARARCGSITYTYPCTCTNFPARRERARVRVRRERRGALRPDSLRVLSRRREERTQVGRGNQDTGPRRDRASEDGRRGATPRSQSDPPWPHETKENPRREENIPYRR